MGRARALFLGAAIRRLGLVLQPIVERFAGTRFWNNAFQPYFLDQPAWLVLGIVGALLIVLGRKKRKLIGFARD